MCEAPRRFEGMCSKCGQLGHAFRHCTLYRRRATPSHANVFASSPPVVFLRQLCLAMTFPPMYYHQQKQQWHVHFRDESSGGLVCGGDRGDRQLGGESGEQPHEDTGRDSVCGGRGKLEQNRSGIKAGISATGCGACRYRDRGCLGRGGGERGSDGRFSSAFRGRRTRDHRHGLSRLACRSRHGTKYLTPVRG